MNIDQIVDRLRELKWHIDDDGEKQLREVINQAGTNANEVKTYEQMEKVKRMLDVAYWAALKARNGLKSALDEAQKALDDIERQQEDVRDKMKGME
jgi:hypothetical protein